jgi:hypothetical protein
MGVSGIKPDRFSKPVRFNRNQLNYQNAPSSVLTVSTWFSLLSGISDFRFTVTLLPGSMSK